MPISSRERWHQIESVFDAALDLPATQRAGFLDRRCAQDADMRQHVEQLLRACEVSEHFLEQPIAGEAAPFVALSLASADLPAAGERVGAYRIVSEAGRGGMGVVYVAERDDGTFRKRVALKLMRRGAGTGDLLTRRFHEERQILASLDHPGIARLLDGGALTDGRPYLVMEYVEGTPIDRFCDDRELDVDARLDLFCKVCDAVQHAHQQQIIHRDLKPTNLLVTGDSAVKLLDFGIATLLTPDGVRDATESTEHTRTGTRILTPGYASPEQVRGEAASAASDVYSLGVILYELLAGRHPFRRSSQSRSIAARRSLEQPLLPPSAAVAQASEESETHESDERAVVSNATARRMHSRLSGALDDIVLTALKSDPARRYPSAGALAAEVRRHLDTRAAAARSPGWAGRARALARRHRAAASVTVLGLALAAVTTAMVIRTRAAPPYVRASSIVVFPFSPSIEDTLLLRLGRDLVATLSANLNGVGELRTVDAQTVLEETNDPRATSPTRSGLARRLGAGMLLRGTLARDGARVRAEGELLSAVDETPIAHVATTADPTNLAALTDSIVWSLLRQLSNSRGLPALGAGAVSTASLPALRAYLEGERLASEYRMRAAAAAYARAVAADSTFWLADWREDWARAFNAAPGDSARVPAYRRHLDELPPPDRMLIEARLTSALPARRERLESLTVRFPAYALGWFELGELGLQQGPFVGGTIAAADGPLRRTVALDPTFVPAWDRLLWVAIAQRDTISSSQALAQLKRLRYDSTSMLDDGMNIMQLYRHLDHLARSNGRPDSALADSVARGLGHGYRPSANGMPDRMQSGIARFEFHRARKELAERELRFGLVPPGFQWQVVAYSWASRGAWDSALVAMDHAVRINMTPQAGMIGYRLAAIGAWLGAIEPSFAATWRARAEGAPDRLRPVDHGELAWLDGLLASVRRDPVALSAARAALRRTGAPDAALLDSSLAAYARELTGDRKGALALLLALERDRYRISNPHPYLAGVNRLTASRWLAVSGDAAEAASLLTWHEAIGYRAPQALHANAVLAPIAELERAPLLDALGQHDAARAHYERFLAAYDSPVPALRPLVVGARSGLDRTDRP